MATGAVKWFNRKKGFGFITPDIGPKDIFVHVSALNGAFHLNEGQRVEFELTQWGDGRAAAFSVRILDERI